MYGLLIIEVWVQDGWILTKYFCVFMDQDRVEVHKLAKKEQGQYPDILTEQAWPVKDNYTIGFWWNFSCGTRQVVPSEQRSSILTAQEANHSAGSGSSWMEEATIGALVKSFYSFSWDWTQSHNQMLDTHDLWLSGSKCSLQWSIPWMNLFKCNNCMMDKMLHGILQHFCEN